MTLCRQIFRVLKMDASVPVDSMVLMQKRALRRYLADSGLTGVVKPGGRQYALKHVKVLLEAIAAGIKPLEFCRKVESEMRLNLVMYDPDALFNIIDPQLWDQAVIDANDAVRRQSATPRDTRLVAVAVTKMQGSAADKHDASQRAETAGVKAERNRQYDNNECFFVASKGTSSGTAPKASRGRRRKAFTARDTARTPSSSNSSSSSNPQAVPISIPGAKPRGWQLGLSPLRLELVGTSPL